MKTIVYRLALLLIAGCTYVTAFPPYTFKEGAFIFALPILLWAAERDKNRWYYGATFLSGWAFWAVLLIWLRHVYSPYGSLGCALLALVVSLFWSSWFWLAGFILPRLIPQKSTFRIAGMLALAGAWVIMEWIRSWLFTGFPWLPLAASQWQNPAMLQLAAWTGYYGVSFVIILFNLGLFFYGHSIWSHVRRQTQHGEEPEDTGHPHRRIIFSAEFYVALACLLGTFGLFIAHLPNRANQQPMFVAGVVQPWIPAEIKWDLDQARETWRVLGELTQFEDLASADVILWPEAATPTAIINSSNTATQRAVEALVNATGRPLLTGNLIEVEGMFSNGLFLVEPGSGLFPHFNLKQRLVPFGEYAPLSTYLPFMSKLVPIAGDIVPGTKPVTLPLQLGNETWQVGSLICYEDIFPSLGRSTVQAGADCIVVVTNDAWYGQEGGAYQHAAHSVLRAVETRRPVIRCGNHGWSGWIDEYGAIRAVVTDPDNSSNIYFRGTGIFSVARDHLWAGKASFYVRYGDWFVGVCAGFCAFFGILCRITTFRSPPVE